MELRFGAPIFTGDEAFDKNRAVREAITATGATLLGSRRLDVAKFDGWRLRVRPSGAGPITLRLEPSPDCAVEGAICSVRGGQLAGAVVSEEIPGLPPLTATFAEVPPEHDGHTSFTLELAFSEPVFDGTERFDKNARIRGAVSVTGGTLRGARRTDPAAFDRWLLTVRPSGTGAVTVTLPATSGGLPLSEDATATVLGPPALSVADAEVEEGADATLAFAVTLDRERRDTVTVDYTTEDASATAGVDYVAASGTLTFAPGETEKTVAVRVLDDAHDEGAETMTLRLSNATKAYILKGEATGTIENSDPLQRAWLSRFGRTVGTHVTDAVGDRLRATPGQGSHLTVGGYRLPLGREPAAPVPASAAGPREAGSAEPDAAPGVTAVLAEVARVLGMGAGAETPPDSPWLNGPGPDPRLGRSRTLEVGERFQFREILLGSSFQLRLNAAASGATTPRLTAWGRVAGTAFDGRDGDLTLDGDVLTGTVGVDGEWDRLLIGVAVAHSRGEGAFSSPTLAARGPGALETTLTSLHPYLRYAVTERLDVWGMVGYGWGESAWALDTGATYDTDTDFVMSAFGGRGILLAAAETGGFQLATRADAMLTRTSTDAVVGANGHLAETEADAHRVRVVLEGSRGLTWADGRSLTPTVELGLRHDAGDAETGFGLELGGRVQYADPRLGLTIEGAVRALLAHEDTDYQEWGAPRRVAWRACGRGRPRRGWRHKVGRGLRPGN